MRRRAAVIRSKPGIAMAISLALCAFGRRTNAQWQIGSRDGDTLRLGYMMQARAEWQHTDPTGPTAQNLFLRHARLLISGKVHYPVSFFVGTDSPNMGKTQPDGTKNNAPIGIYDFWVTYEPQDAFKLDMGLIGTPNSHNSIQSISGMLASDFSPYAFVSTPPTGARAGRDYGAQARGYLLEQHVEYRAAAFQGYRGTTADHEFRYLARIVVDAFRTERSVYYSGTSLGTRKNLAVGVSGDHQEQYNSLGADLYFDHPVAGGDGVTFQLDVTRYDGGRTFPDFPRQRTFLAEAGYFSRATRLAPFVQIARLDFMPASIRDERQLLAGVACFIRGHQLNVKGAYGRMKRSGLPTSTLVQLTFQSFQL
jgi:hypothetical protein